MPMCAFFRFDKQFLLVGNQTAVGKINRPAVGFFQSADHTKRRRFAAAAGAEQGKEFAFFDLEIDAIDRYHPVESLIEILNA